MQIMYGLHMEIMIKYIYDVEVKRVAKLSDLFHIVP